MNDIAVIAPFLDFDDNPLRVKGFLEFKKGLENQNIPFYIIEAFSEGNSPKIKKFCKDNYFSEAVYFPIWIRENLINVLSSKIPSKYKKLAWMDCDVVIQDNDWANKVSNSLEEHKLVKIAEDMSWGGMATHRDFFESIGLFDIDFCGMGDYISYLSATKEDLLQGEEGLLDLYKAANLEIYFKILSYRKKAFEYFKGDCKILNVGIEKFISNQNILFSNSIESKKQKTTLLKYVDLERNISHVGLHEVIKVKNINGFKYSKLFLNYLRQGEVDEEELYNFDKPDPLTKDDNSNIEPSSGQTKHIIKELKNLKLAQFEILQKEAELLKALENQNN